MQCVHCGGRVEIGSPSCPRCGRARPQLPPDFSRAENHYLALRSRFQEGQIDEAAFRTRLRALTFRDEDGRYWTLSPKGDWYTARGKAWVPHDPPVLVSPAPSVSASELRRPAPQPAAPTAGTRRKWLWPAAGCGGFGLIILLLVVYTLIAGYDDYQSSPMLVEVTGGTESAPEGADLSAAQEGTLNERGDPEAFTILFTEETRHEIWTYYLQGIELVFENGELVSETPLDLTVTEVIAPPFRPAQFTAFMSLDDVVAATGLDQYLVIPLEEDQMVDAQVYYGEQLTFGLKADELLFVESLALEVE